MFFDTPPQPTEPLIAIIIQAEEKPKETKPVTYLVKRGDTLSKIARRHHTSVLRLFYKNKVIKHPDGIKVGQKLIIPAKSEKIKTRKIPRPAIIRTFKDNESRISPRISGGYSSSGNTYGYKSCTWWVKYNRPGLPNSLGNAYEWLANARSLGMATGSTPRVGSVGVRGNHVVYVVKVSGEQVYIGDGNYDWQGSYRERWANASDYTYIY